MTSRKEDELDLLAMQIAKEIRNSDNLRKPRNPKIALEWMRRALLDLYPQGRLF